MALQKTPALVRLNKVVPLLMEIKATMDAKAGKQFCLFCVGMMETDLSKFPYRHEDNCIHTHINNWMKGEFEEV
jgi:hypothetical protein